jgi:hypothetical protein
MSVPTSFAGLSDLELLAAVKRLAAEEREATTALIASLVEVDGRRLFRGEGCSSMFDYCTRVLRLSESAAYARIAAARAARGDLAAIFDRALTLLVEHLERTKLGHAKRPRHSAGVADGSRHIPSSVKRAVWDRDAGCCAFSGREGRCNERGFLEFHHVVPYARGGTATVDNIQLRCRAHNQYEAEEAFGPREVFVREERPAFGR